MTLGHTVLAKVKRLLLNRVVLSDVPLLGRAKERLDALRVVAESKEEVLVADWVCFGGRHNYINQV